MLPPKPKLSPDKHTQDQLNSDGHGLHLAHSDCIHSGEGDNVDVEDESEDLDRDDNAAAQQLVHDHPTLLPVSFLSL